MTAVAYVVRHGQSTWNARGVLQGQAPDVPLTALGDTQATAAAASLAGSGATAVYTSDLLRALRTAEPIARALGAPMEVRPGLREQCVGIYQGRRSRDVWAETDPEAWGRVDWRPEGGESISDVAERLMPVLDELRACSGPVVVVTHGDTARIAVGLLRGAAVAEIPWLSLGNGEVLAVPLS
ncbi:MAG: histidine phosphatase family protein [Frankiales bacterium]|nr:MAG: histidine phosphatase family protein [Frankiales bacterium]